MRGKREPAHQGMLGARLIPAREGKTPARYSSSNPAPAHPRACGENSARVRYMSPLGGSSPRVRGKLVHALALLVEAGLIPARAGKTRAGPADPRARRAHPRACGENRRGGRVHAGMPGSSPRVRGKRVGAGDGHLGVGLIPARAGKTGRSGPRRRAWRAHPRVCGENYWHWLHRSGAGGSSPRVRGKH